MRGRLLRVLGGQAGGHCHAKLIICLFLMSARILKQQQKKINCLCFIKMKLSHNVTFAISAESLCMPIDPTVVMAT